MCEAPATNPSYPTWHSYSFTLCCLLSLCTVLRRFLVMLDSGIDRAPSSFKIKYIYGLADLYRCFPRSDIIHHMLIKTSNTPISIFSIFARFAGRKALSQILHFLINKVLTRTTAGLILIRALQSLVSKVLAQVHHEGSNLSDHSNPIAGNCHPCRSCCQGCEQGRRSFLSRCLREQRRLPLPPLSRLVSSIR